MTKNDDIAKCTPEEHIWHRDDRERHSPIVPDRMCACGKVRYLDLRYRDAYRNEGRPMGVIREHARTLVTGDLPVMGIEAAEGPLENCDRGQPDHSIKIRGLSCHLALSAGSNRQIQHAWILPFSW